MEPRAFLRTRYRVKVAKNSDADHWSGGKPYHRGARCPTCKIPLLLLWDFNCKDPRFPRRKFGPMVRLPLYYCWGCVSDISYQVVESDKIHIHSQRRNIRPSFPYDSYPEHFERRGLELHKGIPDEIRRIYLDLIARSNTEGDDAPIPVPSSRDQKTLTEFFGHPVSMPMCFFHHQLGGRPLVNLWADERFECPNPACEGKTADQKHSMKFLAGILNDPWAGLPMIEPATEETRKNCNYFISVQYHICDRCWTVLGCNRCD